ncbi:MAG: phosphoribosylglycinamide formyltransferase [Ruminococcaceae bacterium]|nr:phosphoribosylglycinamide formyltransferase [Oscillospiraceae bacterium]
MLNIAVLVSGSGSNLQAIIDEMKKGEIDGKIVTVVSNKPDVYALKRAEENNIPSKVIVSKGNENFEKELLSHLKENNVDLIVLAGFLCILKGDILKEYSNKIINVHPSLIPSFCGDGFYGLKVHEAALNYGVKVTGATVHFVNEITDGGKIIIQKAVYIKEGDTPEILQRRVMEEAEWKILPQAIKLICNGGL